MSNGEAETTIIGIGNPLRRDDGIGIRIVQELLKEGRFRGVDIIDGGSSPDLPSLLDKRLKKLIIVDALKGGGKPGRIYRLEITEANVADEMPASLHGLGVLDGLKILKILGKEPSAVVIIGIEPQDTSPGLGLSWRIESRIPAIIRAIEAEIHASY